MKATNIPKLNIRHNPNSSAVDWIGSIKRWQRKQSRNHLSSPKIKMLKQSLELLDTNPLGIPFRFSYICLASVGGQSSSPPLPLALARFRLSLNHPHLASPRLKTLPHSFSFDFNMNGHAERTITNHRKKISVLVYR